MMMWPQVHLHPLLITSPIEDQKNRGREVQSLLKPWMQLGMQQDIWQQWDLLKDSKLKQDLFFLLCYMLKHSSYIYVTAKTIGICLWADQVLFCMNVLCPIFCNYCGTPKTTIGVKYFVIILPLLWWFSFHYSDLLCWFLALVFKMLKLKFAGF